MAKWVFVAVIGDSRCSADTAALAEAVGRELALRGAVLVCGGRGGVMEAACKGAKSAGGLTIGILPGASRMEANPYVDVPIATGMGEARNVVIVRSAQAVIAISGEYGTLSEIGHALKQGVPVVGMRTWQLAKAGRAREAITCVETAQEAAERALALAVR